ncbi:MAG TPA: thiol peroxidase [Desulfomonilaceae bacterium]|nr:thiol peroxidase [Desulfomonilaceae bacterium]
MNERSGLVTMRGNPITLLGNTVTVGDEAPNFTVVDTALKPVEFSSFRGKVCVISAVPSLDTPVCDAQTRRFNKEAAGLSSDVAILTISMDLPFAQARWRGAAGIKEVQTFSDHREASFGSAYGLLIKDLRLLARAVFVVDRKGNVEYVEIVKEIADQPDFDAALAAVKRLT